MPNLSDILVRPDTGWQQVMVPGWYGEGDRIVELFSATAVWRHAGMPVVPIRWVLVRDPLGRFEPQALLYAGLACAPEQILRWFVQRWQIEVTFQETRAHRGVETQRQWSDLVIARTTPCLLGRFSIAARLEPVQRQHATATAWYRKRHPTFGDTHAAPCAAISGKSRVAHVPMSAQQHKPRPAFQRAIADAVCHAA